ncbi:hypothetical protein EVAR_85397_1 [Eumeta japonica]|uniref:Uncharacterized protein n=1 Tax=Eumeta variegata TaxID=151549 RepID=A0A4C1SLW5_EUMVA|nr:hypothetical protein EVAR_85397_1 [Eumeta japonica]
MDIDKQYVSRDYVHYPSDESEVIISSDSKGEDPSAGPKPKARAHERADNQALFSGTRVPMLFAGGPKQPGPSPSPATPGSTLRPPGAIRVKKPEQTDNDSKRLKAKTIVVDDDDVPLLHMGAKLYFLWKKKNSRNSRQCELKTSQFRMREIQKTKD